MLSRSLHPRGCCQNRVYGYDDELGRAGVRTRTDKPMHRQRIAADGTLPTRSKIIAQALRERKGVKKCLIADGPRTTAHTCDGCGNAIELDRVFTFAGSQLERALRESAFELLEVA